MRHLISNLWYGTEESYFAFQDAHRRVSEMTLAGPDAIKAAVIAAGGGRGDDPFGMPPLWQAQGNVAVLNIEGSLISGSAGFMRLFGAIGYADIQAALHEIALDKDITSVLMNIDSGGGHVDGVEDTGEVIRALSKLKPVISYTGGTMGSAAYWLGSSADSVLSAKTAQVGSVGTLIVHMERSKQLAASGVTATVVRFGKHKALANAIEPLSEDGQKQLQSLADESGQIFVDYVADRRGMSSAQFQKTAGEGRVFMGRQAEEVGLVDGITNFTGALAKAKSLDKGSAQPQNRANSRKAINMKLSKKTVLALAAGTALDQLGLAEPEANLEGVKLEGDALAAAESEAKEVLAAIDARVDVAVTAATAELTTKLTAAEQAAVDAKAAADAATGKVALAEAAANQFKGQLDVSAEFGAKSAEIVKASMSVMSVALGGAADVGAALTGTELLAEHTRLSDAFKAKFPTGGVAATMGVPKAKATAAVVDPRFRHLVQSMKPATAK